MHNKDLRAEIKAAGLHLWQVAERYGVNDGNFSRKLRKELSADEKAKIKKIIKQLSKEVI